MRPGEASAPWKRGGGSVQNKSKQGLCIAGSPHVGFPPQVLMQAEMVDKFKAGLAQFTDRLD